MSYDDVFYGDYRSKQSASEAAGDLQALLAASGRKARIAFANADGRPP